jgi:hypothetical protein
MITMKKKEREKKETRIIARRRNIVAALPSIYRDQC